MYITSGFDPVAAMNVYITTGFDPARIQTWLEVVSQLLLCCCILLQAVLF